MSETNHTAPFTAVIRRPRDARVYRGWFPGIPGTWRTAPQLGVLLERLGAALRDSMDPDDDTGDGTRRPAFRTVIAPDTPEVDLAEVAALPDEADLDRDDSTAA